MSHPRWIYEGVRISLKQTIITPKLFNLAVYLPSKTAKLIGAKNSNVSYIFCFCQFQKQSFSKKKWYTELKILEIANSAMIFLSMC